MLNMGLMSESFSKRNYIYIYIKAYNTILISCVHFCPKISQIKPMYNFVFNGENFRLLVVSASFYLIFHLIPLKRRSPVEL